MLQNPDQILQRYNMAKGRRGTLDNHLQEIGDYFIPRKSEITVDREPGEKISIFVTETTGAQSAQLLASALQSLLTNPNSDFFRFTTGDEKIDNRDDVRGWLQKTSRDVMNILNNSNFQTEIHEFYLDLVTMGTACIYIEEDNETHIRFSTKQIGEIVVMENNRGLIDETYRKFKWDTRNIVREFGLQNVGKTIADQYKKDDTKEFELIQAIYPIKILKDEKIPERLQGMEFVSQVLFPQEKKILEERGYKEQPFAVARWLKGSGEIYGRSPAMTTLPDVKMINEMDRTTLEGAQKTIDPAMQVEDEGAVMPIDLTPGGLNFVRPGGEGIRPIFNAARIDFGFEYLKERRQRIREGFFIDQLQLREGPQMTATEVLQRTEEQVRLLGPVASRQRSEFLRPMLDRAYAIADRRGQIDPVPRILRELKARTGKDLDVQYSSVIARSQRISDAQNITRAIEVAAPFVQADPTVLDNISGDEAFRVIARIFELPQQILRNTDEVKKLRAQRQQRQEEVVEQQKNLTEAETLEMTTRANKNLQAVG